MSRAARLFRLTHLLAGRRSWRVVDLARELEMTRRTIYRDIDELSACGIPVFHDGRGYRLLDDARTPPLHLDAAERAVLQLALGNPVIERHATLAPALKSLRAKLRATSATAEEAPSALQLASIDRSGSMAVEAMQVLEHAVSEGRQMRIRYQSLSGGTERWRGLDPYAVFHRGEAWYVIGRCHANDELRIFRLDRIVRARLVRLRQRAGGERLHNRYILTDLGGVTFGVGLDEGDAADTDDVQLLDRAQYEERWRQYANEAPAFDRPEPPITIEGVA